MEDARPATVAAWQYKDTIVTLAEEDMGFGDMSGVAAGHDVY